MILYLKDKITGRVFGCLEISDKNDTVTLNGRYIGTLGNSRTWTRKPSRSFFLKGGKCYEVTEPEKASFSLKKSRA